MTTATFKIAWEHTGGYYSLPNNLARGKVKDLNGTERHTIMSLLSFANKLGECFPSYQTIADAIDKSRSTVIRVIKSLVRKGYVSKKKRKRKDDNGDTSNLYKVNLYKIGIKTEIQNDTPPVPNCNSKEQSVKEDDDTYESMATTIQLLVNKSELSDNSKKLLTERVLNEIKKGRKIVNLEKYVDKAIRIELENEKVLEDINVQKPSKKSNMSKSKANKGTYGLTSFHNFPQVTAKYSDKELEEVFRRKNEHMRRDINVEEVLKNLRSS